jgi:amino acid adenylation domain-containing protein
LKYDILVEVDVQGNDLHCTFKYWEEFLSVEQATTVASAFSHALSMILDRSQQSVRQVELFSRNDEIQVAKWNGKEPQRIDRCAHDLIQEQCRAQPDAPAISAWDGNLTYGELDDLSSCLAQHLTDRGVGRGVFVPLCFAKCRWTPVAVLGVIKAGGAFVLMDPSHPVDRLREICESVHARLTLASPEHASMASQLTPETLVIGGQQTQWRENSPVAPLPLASPDDALYAVFTSGSTGKPKGIIMEHGAFCAGAISVSQAVNLHAQSRLFQFSSYAFDVSVSDNLMPLIVGGCVCIPSDLDRRENLIQVMNDLQVTWLATTPTVARLLRPDLVPTLQTLILGGEPMLPSDVLTWAPHLDLCNLYGPAECAVSVTWRGPLTTDCDPVGIGHATSGATAWVVDPSDHEKLVPIGAVGELVMEGPVVARGYIHNHCQTTPPFTHPPRWLSRFRSKPNGHLYKTGDLVQYTPDGSLRFIGRKDTQAKLRGQRIELGEVEYHVREEFQGAVDVIAEVAKPSGQHASPVLVAFVYSGSEEGGETKEKEDGKETTVFGCRSIQSFEAHVVEASSRLGEILPSYMVPSVFVPLIRIPMTKTGKTDRKLLRQLAGSMSREELDFFVSSKTGGREPATEMERRMKTLVAQTLGLAFDKVWADSHFFRLGGDSVMAMRLVAAARKEGLKVSVFDIFNRPQLYDLAAAVQDSVGPPTQKTIPAFSLLPSSDVEEFVEVAARQCDLLPEDIEDIYPCTALQEGLISLTAKKAGMYTAQFVYQVPSEVRWDRLQTAWQTTVDANAILRTRIIQTESHGSFQVLSCGFHIDWFQGSSVDRYLVDDAAKPMELGQPLVRFAVFSPVEGGVQPSSIVVTIHHALYDGISFPLLVDQVKMAYDGQQLEPCPFNPFIKYITSQDSTAVRDFWVAEFADLDAPVFPPLKETTRNPSPTKSVRRAVDIAFSNRGATLSNVLRLAWAIVVSQYTDSDDVVFGVTVTGRSAEVDNIELLTGPTFATFPFRVRLRGEEAVHTALEDVQNHATKLIPFEQTGLQRIRRMGREAAAACNFQSQLGLQHAWKQDDSDGRLMIPQTDHTDYSGFASYAFVLICSLTENDSLDVLANFDPSIVEPHEADRLVAQFAHVLQQLCAHPERRISEVEVVSPQDIEQLLLWNSALPEPCEQTIHDLVLRQCSQRPGAPAISSWDRKLSFRELQGLSAQLAQELVSAGVRPGSLVPMCFEKSIWPVVTMLAVLRAGGTCVNVDHNLPTERIKVMLQDIESTVIVASAAKKHLVESSLSSEVTIITVPSVTMQNPLAKAAFTSPSVSPRDAAFIMFTSGSTGKPKAIIMEHVNLSTSIRDHSGPMNVGPDTRTLHFAAYAFDASIYEIFTTLVNGGCVCIPSESDRMSNLAGFIRDHQVSLAVLTPSALTTLQPSEVPDLKTIVLGGEAVTQDNVDTWASKVSLINGYGPAETTICAAGRIPQLGWRTGTIGPIVGGVGWVTVPSDPSRLAPLGAVGELLIEGPVVARGYLNEPGKTKAGFIDTPPWLQRLRPHGPGRVYRSGDLVQFNSDGWIRFIGRKDTQVKLRGQRIELGEIEHHVRTHFQGAREVIAEVIKRGSDRNSSLLVAFICCGDGSGEGVDADVLFSPPQEGQFHSKVLATRARLQDLLPPYMVPSVLLPLSHVPLTKTGKIDRRRLREEAASLSQDELQKYSWTRGEKRAPSTENEAKLQEIWAQVLNLPPEDIGMNDNFFRIGGDSIVAMRLVIVARQNGLQFTVPEVFKYPRLYELALVMEETMCIEFSNAAARSVSLLNVDQREETLHQIAANRPFHVADIVDVLPITESQRTFIQWCVCYIIEIPGQIDLGRLETAIRAVLEKYSILRTVFLPFQRTIAQIVLRQADIQLQKLTTDKDMTLFTDSVCQQQCRSFTALGSPHFQPIIISQEKSERHSLVLRMSHAQYDGFSSPLLLKDIATAYEGNPLTPAPGFSDYMAYRADQNNSPALFQFWRELLQGSSMTTLQERVSLEGLDDAHTQTAISVERETRMPHDVPEGITMATINKAAWSIVLARLTSQHDLVFGQVVAGRNIPMEGVENILGPCCNFLPVRVTIQSDFTVRDLLTSIQNQHSSQMAYETADFKDIVTKSTSWPQDTRLGSLVQYINFEMDKSFSLAGVPCSFRGHAKDILWRGVYVRARSEGERIILTILSNSGVMDNETAARLLGQQCELIADLAANPEKLVSTMI